MIKQSVIAMSLAFSVTSGASASTLYGTSFTNAPTSSLYTINQTTGAVTLVGNTGRNLGDLTNIANALVGIDLTANTLWTVNASTGATSNAVAITGTRGTITSIAWNPITQLLYGNTTNSFSATDILYQINAVTGAATLIGSLSVTDLFGLGFGTNGTLYASDTAGTLYSVNTGTAAVSTIGASGTGSLFDLAARPEDNVLFGSPTNGSLVTLNKTTGVGTLVGAFGSGSPNIAGLAFLSAVPEPATWGMMVAGFGLIGATLRRRSPKLAAA